MIYLLLLSGKWRVFKRSSLCSNRVLIWFTDCYVRCISGKIWTKHAKYYLSGRLDVITSDLLSCFKNHNVMDYYRFSTDTLKTQLWKSSSSTWVDFLKMGGGYVTHSFINREAEFWNDALILWKVKKRDQNAGVNLVVSLSALMCYK